MSWQVCNGCIRNEVFLKQNIMWVVLVGTLFFSLVTHLRVNNLSADLRISRDCSAGHVLDRCSQALGQPSDEYTLPGDKASKVQLWKGANRLDYSDVVLISSHNIIREVLLIDYEPDRAIYTDKYRR